MEIMLANTAKTANITNPILIAAESNTNLLTKPAKSGTPPKEAKNIARATAKNGLLLPKPSKAWISNIPLSSRNAIMAKIPIIASACVRIWKSNPVRPSNDGAAKPIIINPDWPIIE